MFCSKCGTQINQGASFCAGCGNPSATTPVATNYSAPTTNFQTQSMAPQGLAAPVTSGLAVASFVVSLFVPLIGLILGYVARSDIRKSGGQKIGIGFTTAAIVIGWIFTVFIFVIIVAAIASAQSSSYY